MKTLADCVAALDYQVEDYHLLFKNDVDPTRPVHAKVIIYQNPLNEPADEQVEDSEVAVCQTSELHYLEDIGERPFSISEEALATPTVVVDADFRTEVHARGFGLESSSSLSYSSSSLTDYSSKSVQYYSSTEESRGTSESLDQVPNHIVRSVSEATARSLSSLQFSREASLSLTGGSSSEPSSEHCDKVNIPVPVVASTRVQFVTSKLSPQAIQTRRVPYFVNLPSFHEKIDPFSQETSGFNKKLTLREIARHNLNKPV